MVLNTGSVVGYNNQLRQAGPGMGLSNPIHCVNAQTAAASGAHPSGDSPPSETPKESTRPAESGNESDDVNKILVAVGAVAIAGLVFLSMR